jgi:tyrosine-protein kinase Etk/Wzc
MRGIIESAAESYDYVVIDSPPILPIHDSRVLAQYADMTLFVVRQELVSYTEVLEALKLLESNGTLVDGLVYNGFIPSPIRYGYGGYAYAYGYRGYRTGSYQYGYGGKRADYSSYYGSSNNAEISNPDNQSENIATLAEVVTPDPSTQLDEMRLLGRVFHRFSQLRTKLVGLILRKYRKGAGDDEDVA